MCNEVATDLIIGLPSIKYFNLLPILQDYLDTNVCCEILVAEGDRAKSRQPLRDKADGATSKVKNDTDPRKTANMLPRSTRDI